MTKNKRKKKGGYKPPPEKEGNSVERITSLASQIASADDAGSLWGQLHKAFLNSDVDAATAAKIIMHRDQEELATVVEQLQIGSRVELDEVIEEVHDVSFATMREALKVFRRRVKLIKLDQESKLGVGPLSGGKDANFDSIMAPHDYPMHVWKALAKDGQLIDGGGGFFRVP